MHVNDEHQGKSAMIHIIISPTDATRTRFGWLYYFGNRQMESFGVHNWDPAATNKPKIFTSYSIEIQQEDEPKQS